MGDTQLFLVRVWQGQHEVRAAVRVPGDGVPVLFTEPGRLGEYLFNAAIAASADANAEPDPARE